MTHLSKLQIRAVQAEAVHHDQPSGGHMVGLGDGDAVVAADNLVSAAPDARGRGIARRRVVAQARHVGLERGRGRWVAESAAALDLGPGPRHLGVIVGVGGRLLVTEEVHDALGTQLLRGVASEQLSRVASVPQSLLKELCEPRSALNIVYRHQGAWVCCNKPVQYSPEAESLRHIWAWTDETASTQYVEGYPALG